MRLTIRGCDTETKTKTKQATRWYLDHLLSKRLQSNLSISILYSDTLFKKQQIEGECIWNDDFDTRRPKKFTINIDNQVRLRSKLIALAHELVDLKQWTKGEMYEYVRDANRYKWKNTVVNVKGIDYYDLPWEVEAHGREIGMYIRMCEHFKWSKEDWTKEYVPMYGDRKCGLTDILKKYENDLTKLTE